MARKAVKQAKKLKARIADWEAISGTTTASNKKTVSKPCGAVLSFTRPGSNKK